MLDSAIIRSLSNILINLLREWFISDLIIHYEIQSQCVVKHRREKIVEGDITSIGLFQSE